MSLYLKYRPQDFESIVGQTFAKETLKSAIVKDKLVGAYIFTGPKGTGKTSSARIFAKAINCLNNSDGNPCNNCEICKNFDEGKLTDVIEIDAASNTGVDNVRDIIEKSNFTPNLCKYKVYIIDEVHMLSKGAFNALLKILEEPPSYLKFILATTEINKVPETILSRCQRYDFFRFSEKEVVGRLKYISEKEGITATEKGLKIIAKLSYGGLRDAINIFEQQIRNDEINEETIEESLGLTSDKFLEDFINLIVDKDRQIFTEIENLQKKGKNIKIFLKNVNLKLSEKSIKENFDSKLFREYLIILENLSETFGKLKNSDDESLTLTIGILKIFALLSGNYQVGNISLENSNKSKNNGNDSNVHRPVDITTNNNSAKNQKEVEIEKIEEINVSDIENIFGNDEIVFSDEEFTVSQEKNIPKKENSGNFNKEEFIGNLKSSGAKGALTMSLRSSEIFIIGEVMQIKTVTSIAKGNIENSDNLAKINEVLKQMGFEIKVNIS